MIPEPLRFAVLGPLRILRAGAELSPGSPQERVLLALLLARAGEPVPVAEIVEALWGPCPPQSAVNVTRRHVGTLRRLLEPDLPARASGHWLLRNAGGYRLRTDAGSLDLLRFRELRERARQATAQGTPAPAVELLIEALSLWRDPVAADIPEVARAHTAFRSLTHERAAAAQEAADAALSAGIPESVLPELRRAAVDHPLDEPLLARLILLLAACGLRTEAVQTYERARTLLAKERGGIPLVQQVLFYPVTDASFDTGSYHQFATGYFLRCDGMQWFWDQYTTDESDRAQITASPLRATTEQLAGLPPALVITAEADVLRDEGEAYAGKLREAGVPVTAVRVQGIIHDFVMLNALRETHAAEVAITLAATTLRGALHAG
ncbi:alpha/beta hydrolase fold domain-containing protein [Streptomyces sp. NPDC001156]